MATWNTLCNNLKSAKTRFVGRLCLFHVRWHHGTDYRGSGDGGGGGDCGGVGRRWRKSA